MNKLSVNCDYCQQLAFLVSGDVIYPHRPDLAGKKFYQCKPCGAYVGCHPDGNGNSPLGRLANAELRKAKQAAHAAFDPIWRDGGVSRKGAYKWLGNTLGLTAQQAHIGKFDVSQCHAVVVNCKTRADKSA